jgi:hypothetical protein
MTHTNHGFTASCNVVISSGTQTFGGPISYALLYPVLQPVLGTVHDLLYGPDDAIELSIQLSTGWHRLPGSNILWSGDHLEGMPSVPLVGSLLALGVNSWISA